MAELRQPARPRGFKSVQVHDPAQSLDGDVRDLWVHRGKILALCQPGEAPEGVDHLEAETVNCEGQIAMAAAIDIHTHLIAPVNTKTIDLPYEVHPQVIHEYRQMGYAALLEAAVPLALAEKIREGQDAHPEIEIYFLLSLDSREVPQDEPLEAYCTRVLSETGAYGFKLVDQPLDLIDAMLDVNEALKMPHALHVHLPNLGRAGAIETVREVIELSRGRRLHLAHIQYYAYSGEDIDNSFSHQQPAVQELLTLLSDNPHVSADLGMVDFGPSLLLSEDFPLIETLADISQQSSGEVTLAGRTYFKSLRLTRMQTIRAHVLQWLTGLAIALEAPKYDCLGQLAMSMDHPNGGALECLPRLLTYLSNSTLRYAVMSHFPVEMRRLLRLVDAELVLSINQIATLTRQTPARLLGMPERGHLKPGADANLVLYEKNEAGVYWDAPRRLISAGELI